MQQPPADRPEDPLPEEQRQADAEEQPGEDRGADREPAEGGDALDLVADLLELGLRELDVGLDEAAARGNRWPRSGRAARAAVAAAAASSPGFDRSAVVAAGVASRTRPIPWTRRACRGAAGAADARVSAGGPSPVPSGCSAGGGSTGSGLGGAGDCDSSSGWAPRVCASGRPGDDTSGRRRDRRAPGAAACCSDVAVGRTVRPLPAARGRRAGRRRRRTRTRGGTPESAGSGARPAAVRQSVPLELLDPVRQLRRAARRGDVGVGPAARRVADVVVGDRRAASRARAGRGPAPRGSTARRRGASGRRRRGRRAAPPATARPRRPVARRRRCGRLDPRSRRRARAGTAAPRRRPRPTGASRRSRSGCPRCGAASVGEEVGAARRELALADRGVEQLARPAGQRPASDRTPRTRSARCRSSPPPADADPRSAIRATEVRSASRGPGTARRSVTTAPMVPRAGDAVLGRERRTARGRALGCATWRRARPADPDRRAAQHRHGADGRRDARHERRRAGPEPHRRSGVAVRRIQALPDDLDAVRDAFATALGRADLVVSTGGLGPTPDDLTREAIAAVARRGAGGRRGPRGAGSAGSGRGAGSTFPAMNLKQAWLDPVGRGAAERQRDGARLVGRPTGRRVVVALPGPPREMRPMWQSTRCCRDSATAAPARTARAGRCGWPGSASRQVADLLGEALLRATNPIVATYARAEAVDVRISARGARARAARRRVDAGPRPGPPRRTTSGPRTRRPGATRSARRSRSAAGRARSSRSATGGSLAALLGDVPWLTLRRDARDAPATATGSRAARDATDGLEHLAPARPRARRGRAHGGRRVRARARGRGHRGRRSSSSGRTRTTASAGSRSSAGATAGPGRRSRRPTSSLTAIRDARRRG